MLYSFKLMLEGKQPLELLKLPYKRTDLEPVMSKATIDYHYAELAGGYVKRFNKNEGDPVFNKAGAFLHNIFFPQLIDLLIFSSDITELYILKSNTFPLNSSSFNSY